MNTPAFDTNLLIDELQLGVQLNKSVHTRRRSDFGLMLSMLTDDVLAFSQFKLPETVQGKREENEDTLRNFFELPKKPLLALKNTEQISQYSQGEYFQKGEGTAFHLNEALSPKPLAFRDDKRHIEANILSNTTLYCQQKYQKQHASNVQEKLNFNVNEWLKVVQTSLVKAPLLNVAV